MAKEKISSMSSPFTMPMAVVSAYVDGRVNHLAVAWFTRTNIRPPMIGMTLNRGHHTNHGIQHEREFGLSIPSVDHVAAVDHVGIVSGASHDKSEVFEVFHGALARAPMIQDFPLAMACRLVQVVELPTHEFFIGEVVETWCERGCLDGSVADPEKVRPFSLTMPDNRYWALGGAVADAWRVGKGWPR